MELNDILSLKRPSLQQDHWLDEVRSWLPETHESHVDADGDIMAFTVTIGEPNATLYCCHLDTVHLSTGRQTLGEDLWPGSLKTEDGECLGADDGAGIWLLLEMMDAGTPGTYLFHLGEESGCIGSRWMAVHQRAWLKQFDRAISFDRPGTTDVITHLCGQRSCSPGFALNVSLELSLYLPGYVLTPSDQGGSTDVRCYIGLIPECTNISIGYHRQHTRSEWLDVTYLMALRDAMIAFGSSPLLTQERAQQSDDPAPEEEVCGEEDELADCF